MYNIVYYKDLVSAGVSTRVIRQAQECCMRRLCRGVYTVLLDCSNNAHRRIARFIDNPSWTELHSQKTPAQLRDDFSYQEQLRRLRVLSYLRYRSGDTVWGTSAALIHGIPLFGVKPGPIFVVHPTSGSRSTEIIRTVRTVDRADQCTFSHLVITRPIRTSLDLVRQEGQQAGFAAMEAVLRTSILGAEAERGLRFGYPSGFRELARKTVVENWYPAIARLPNGHATARRMADSLNPMSESIAESFCSFDLHALQISGFEQQISIRDDRGFVGRVDFVHEETKTIIEVDGIGKYLAEGREAMNKESDRHNRLLSMGYTIVRMRFKDLLHLNTFATKLYAQAPGLRRFAGAVR
ncbi:DUF559 domain-containing protein [Brevibacterium picturae]|uniref:DUF559 domain-containing protein n=1 Tax=Brevibacterium picturae TaxID=260553 RepID=UPI0031F978C2